MTAPCVSFSKIPAMKISKLLSAPLLLGIPLLFLFNSCGSFRAPEFQNVDNIRLRSLESPIRADLHYYNPNQQKLVLKSARGKAWINNMYIGEFWVDSTVVIPARASFRLPVQLKADLKGLARQSLLLFLQQDATVTLKGKAKLGKGLFFINYPIDYRGQQDLGKWLQ